MAVSYTMSSLLVLLCLRLSHAALLPPGLLNQHLSKRSAEAEEHMVQEGRTIELQCRASGRSPPMITWRHNDDYIEQGPLDTMAENVVAPPNPTTASSGAQQSFFTHDYATISTLIIKNARPEHSGVYKCVADLPDSKATKSFSVTVTPAASSQGHGQPSKRSEPADGETRIYMYTDEVYEFEGASARFICRATQGINKPPPTTIWYINGEPVTSEMPGIKKLPNGDLVIERVDQSLRSAGLMCEAIGDDGSSDRKEPFCYIFSNE